MKNPNLSDRLNPYKIFADKDIFNFDSKSSIYNIQNGFAEPENEKIEALKRTLGFLYYNSKGISDFFTETRIIAEI